MTGKPYDREEALKARFNQFWGDVFQTRKDLYTVLDLDRFVQLKTALKNVNDILTYKTTLVMLEWLRNKFNIDGQTFQIAKQHIACTKPNSNGYDIMVDTYRILAEVKCNIPINEGTKFGAEQCFQIEKDIKKLFQGNKRTKVNNDDYYKFLAIYDSGDGVREAVNSLIVDFPFDKKLNGRVKIFTDVGVLDKSVVYVVLVK